MKVFKRGSVYYLRLYEKGREIWRSLGRDRHQAYEHAKELVADYKKRKHGLPTNRTIVEVAELFLERTQVQCKEATYDQYTWALSNFVDFFRRKQKRDPDRVRIVTRADIDQFIGYRKSHGLAIRSLNAHLIPLRAMFRWAQESGYMADIPKIRTLRETKKRPVFYSLEDLGKIIKAAHPEMRDVLYIAMVTGMRRGEIAYLRWEDVNFQRRLFRVWAETTKGRKERELPMNEEAEKLLRARSRPTEWVFYPNANKRKWLGHNLYRGLKGVLKKAGLKKGTFHRLRHSFASHLIMAGTDIVTVKELLGHASITTTMVYSHLNSEHLQKAVRKLNGRMPQLPGKEPEDSADSEPEAPGRAGKGDQDGMS